MRRGLTPGKEITLLVSLQFKEKEVRRLGLVLITLFLGVIPALAENDFSKVEIKATKVAGNVYMLEGSGGNIGVSVGPDGILIVDDEFAPLADKIKAALKGLGAGKLKFILNTHWHGDHTGAAQPGPNRFAEKNPLSQSEPDKDPSPRINL